MLLVWNMNCSSNTKCYVWNTLEVGGYWLHFLGIILIVDFNCFFYIANYLSKYKYLCKHKHKLSALLDIIVMYMVKKLCFDYVVLSTILCCFWMLAEFIFYLIFLSYLYSYLSSNGALLFRFTNLQLKYKNGHVGYGRKILDGLQNCLELVSWTSPTFGNVNLKFLVSLRYNVLDTMKNCK